MWFLLFPRRPCKISSASVSVFHLSLTVFHPSFPWSIIRTTSSLSKLTFTIKQIINKTSDVEWSINKPVSTMALSSVFSPHSRIACWLLRPVRCEDHLTISVFLVVYPVSVIISSTRPGVPTITLSVVIKPLTFVWASIFKSLFRSHFNRELLMLCH